MSLRRNLISVLYFLLFIIIFINKLHMKERPSGLIKRNFQFHSQYLKNKNDNKHLYQQNQDSNQYIGHIHKNKNLEKSTSNHKNSPQIKRERISSAIQNIPKLKKQYQTGIKFFDIQYQRIQDLKRKYLQPQEYHPIDFINNYATYIPNNYNSLNFSIIDQLNNPYRTQRQYQNIEYDYEQQRNKKNNNKINQQNIKKKQNEQTPKAQFQFENKKLTEYFQKLEDNISPSTLIQTNKTTTLNIKGNIVHNLPQHNKSKSNVSNTNIIKKTFVDNNQYKSNNTYDDTKQKRSNFNFGNNSGKIMNEPKQNKSKSVILTNPKIVDEGQRRMNRINEINSKIENKVKDLNIRLEQKQKIKRQVISEYQFKKHGQIQFKQEDQHMRVFYQHLEQQIKCDINFRNFREMIPKDQLQNISKTIYKINPKITKDKLIIQNYQLNPFEQKKQFKSISKELLISQLIKSYQNAEKYFFQYLFHRQPKMVVDSWLQKIDTEKTGIITIGNIATNINLRTSKDYRNKDLLKIAERINGKKQFTINQLESTFIKK